jgi:membrane protein
VSAGLSASAVAKSRLRTTWRVGKDAVDGFWRNDGSAVAGYIAFSGLLAIFPFLIFVTMLFGTIIGEDRVEDLTQALFEIVPADVAMTLEPVVEEVVDGASERILTFAAIFAIYVASNAVESFRVAFDRAYRVIDPRGFVVARVIAVGFVFLGAIVSVLLGASILLTPLIIRVLEGFGVPVPGFASYLANAFGLVVFTGFVYLLHRSMPGKSMAGKLLWPGVMFTTVVWLAAAVGFSIYLTYTPTYSITYGALAGVIITLMFFYITGAIIIFGAELNAALNRAIGRAELEEGG